MATGVLQKRQKTMNGSWSSGVSIQYTDVVVIGNGPSGINLSYMLSGNWPYFTGGNLQDEYLQMRLGATNKGSLVQQDLEFLSTGLEGRSSNPVAVLFDTLTHPYADLGQQMPSTLKWKLNKQEAINHVVLGKNREGGVWQTLKGDMQTLSLGNWMELPALPFKEWLANHREKHRTTTLHKDRASIDEVRCYYEDYVRIHNLQENFRNYTTVTSVERVLDVTHSIDVESGEQIPCDKDHCDKCMWEVRGYCMEPHNNTGQQSYFCFRAPHVVLASGAHDQPNKLNVEGENLPFVHHNLHEVEVLICSAELNSESRDPLVVIGAGLSAADAIIYALKHGIAVVHVFRDEAETTNVVYSKLPSNMYPEYNEIHMLMQGKMHHPLYQSYPAHHVVEFRDDSTVMIRHHNTRCDSVISTCCVIVQIGYKSNLSYLQQGGKNLTRNPSQPISPKHNPIVVNPYTYESIHQPNLFSIGPLVGDNFVRYLCGGALAITGHLWHKKQKAFLLNNPHLASEE